MNVLFTIGAFVIVFSILVLVHEFGHFIAAKRAGIKVEEFGIGFPPKIWSRKKGDTVYSINAVPFGGFVRLLGMEGSKKGTKKGSKKSFANRNMRVRAKVMIAGVLMNLILAWTLISVGFTFGMEPLLGPDDVFVAVSDGIIELQEGAVIEEIGVNSLASSIGLEKEDILIEFKGDPIVDGEQLVDLLMNPVGEYVIVRDGERKTLDLSQDNFDSYLTLLALTEEKVSESNVLGVNFYDAFGFPRVKIFEVEEGSNAHRSGLRNEDIIIAAGGQQVYHLSQYREVIEALDGSAVFTVSRNGIRKDIVVEMNASSNVIVSSVISGKPADESGIKAGDVVLSVNGRLMTGAQELVNFVSENRDQVLAFTVERKEQVVFFEITPEDGKIGVYLSELFTGADSDVSVYNTDQFTSVIDIKDEQYPIYSAPFHALSETWRMTKMTGGLFIDFIRGFVSSGEVPETVTGPVGIAQMTGAFAHEGFIPLIRFIAILSISLAVLNILPFPALDGGKLLFILIEFVLGRKVPMKWENYIHAFGYLIIIGLILAITYRDILRFIM